MEQVFGPKTKDMYDFEMLEISQIKERLSEFELHPQPMLLWKKEFRSDLRYHRDLYASDEEFEYQFQEVLRTCGIEPLFQTKISAVKTDLDPLTPIKESNYCFDKIPSISQLCLTLGEHGFDYRSHPFTYTVGFVVETDRSLVAVIYGSEQTGTHCDACLDSDDEDLMLEEGRSCQHHEDDIIEDYKVALYPKDRQDSIRWEASLYSV